MIFIFFPLVYRMRNCTENESAVQHAKGNNNKTTRSQISSQSDNTY